MKNKHKFEIAMSAIISEQVAKEMIIKEIEQSIGKQVTSIEATYDSDNKFVGFQAFFDHDSEIKKKKIQSSNEFIQWNFEGKN